MFPVMDLEPYVLYTAGASEWRRKISFLYFKITVFSRGTVCTPENVSDIQHFLGMYNQLSMFVPNLADETKPLSIWTLFRLLVGLKFSIETDHKSLIPLFSMKHLEELPVRIQCLRLWMLRFDFNIIYVPGKSWSWQMLFLELLRWHWINTISTLRKMFKLMWMLFSGSSGNQTKTWRDPTCTREDPLCQEVAQYCWESWPEKGWIKVWLNDIIQYCPKSQL